jgi:hypothetical protein
MYRKLLMAAVASVISLALAGAANAAKQGEACGGTAAVQCDAGLWCQSAPGACAAMGRCAKAPDICNQMFQPVCGCDGKTYGNDCERQAHKVSKAHEGACS